MRPESSTSMANEYSTHPVSALLASTMVAIIGRAAYRPRRKPYGTDNQEHLIPFISAENRLVYATLRPL